MLTLTQKLERAAQLLIDKQDNRRRAYAEYIAAQHEEAQAGHELREALSAYKPSIDPAISNTVRLLAAAQHAQAGGSASQPPNATLPGNMFHGVRD